MPDEGLIELPHEWKLDLAEELRRRDVEYLGNLNSKMPCGVPDGPFCTFCYPMGVEELTTLENAINKSGSLFARHLSVPNAPMAIPSIVRSIVREDEPGEIDLAKIFRDRIEDLGGLPLEYPREERIGPKKTPVVIIDQLSYLWVSITPFAGIFELIDALKDALPRPLVRTLDRFPLLVTATPPSTEPPTIAWKNKELHQWFVPADNRSWDAVLHAMMSHRSKNDVLAPMKTIRALAKQITAAVNDASNGAN
jgi:hypothetical protein